MKRSCARASASIASRDPARASETRIWSLLSSYSSDKGCIIELSKIQQTGAKFNFTDEGKEWLGDHPDLWAWPRTLEANNDRQISAIIKASNYVEEGLITLGRPPP